MDAILTKAHEIVNQPSNGCEPMTEIAPGLFLSGNTHIDHRYLKKNGIKRILNVGAGPYPRHFLMGREQQPQRIEDIEYLWLDVEDIPNQDIAKFFQEAFHFLDYGYGKVYNPPSEKVRTLIHCAAGISRSPTITVAYLITHYNMHLLNALAFVKYKRSCVHPNDGFLEQLVKLYGPYQYI
jgi:protein tyrosine phosphatase